MEEETKPESLLLNEKNVKLENDDSWGEIRDSNVKEELLDHDYCMRNPVKQKEIDDSVDQLVPKLEEPDYYNYPMSESGSEALFKYPEYLKTEPKLEESDDFGYTISMQNSVKLEEIDYFSEDLVESRLEEPDDFEYPENPKLEPIKTDHDIGPIRKQSSDSKRKWKSHNRKCAICHELVRPDHFICTESSDRQMILMLGLVIAQKKSVEEAQQLITGNQLCTCNAHLKEAVTEIYKALDIESVYEVNQCSNDEFQKIMDINRNMCPHVSFSQFCRALNDFVVKYKKIIGPIGKQCTSSIRKQCNWLCSVCRELVCLNELHWITSEVKQSILMLGLILKGTKTIEEAQLFISRKGIYTCTAHLKDAVFEIFRVLNIKSLEEFIPCGNKNMQISIEKLLDILKVMCPEFSFSQFQNALVATATMVIRGSSTIKALKQKRWCMVCHQLENVKGFTDIISKEDKLILLVGLIIGKKKTIREAKLLITYPTFFCCQSHLSEAGYKILEVLKMKRIEQLHSCPVDILMDVMAIVWKVCPVYTVSQFKIHLTKFLQMFPITISN